MTLWSRIFRVSFAALMVCGVSFWRVGESMAQEDFFNPPIEAPPTKTPLGGQQVYSFARLDADFTAICGELELAGRRERIVMIAEEGVEREKQCISCRSFWKMIVGACGRLGPKPTRVPKINRKAGKDLTESDGSAEQPESSPTKASHGGTVAGKDEGGQSTPKKLRDERYPSVALIDRVSRFSATIYEDDNGEGATARMLHYFAKTIRDAPGMSSAEREYYDIFLTYLLAAWDGRVDRTKLPTPTPSSELRELFDFN